MLMANAVSQLAAKTPGKEAAAMEAFAAALRQVSQYLRRSTNCIAALNNFLNIFICLFTSMMYVIRAFVLFVYSFQPLLPIMQVMTALI